jgi:ATP-dependent Clp protease adaptor protein ClpS
MGQVFEAPAEVELPGEDEVEQVDRPWVVIVWNDPVNLMTYVTYVFQKLFGYAKPKAEKLMLQVHEEGRAAVSTGTREKAEADVARLFPAAFRDDDEAAAEFAELTRDGLEHERLAAFDTVARTIGADELDEAEAAAWCGALNDARLVLGERLGVTEELYATGIRRDDPRAPELAFYAWITWLQGELVEALASRL